MFKRKILIAAFSSLLLIGGCDATGGDTNSKGSTTKEGQGTESSGGAESSGGSGGGSSSGGGSQSGGGAGSGTGISINSIVNAIPDNITINNKKTKINKNLCDVNFLEKNGYTKTNGFSSDINVTNVALNNLEMVRIVYIPVLEDYKDVIKKEFLTYYTGNGTFRTNKLHDLNGVIYYFNNYTKLDSYIPEDIEFEIKSISIQKEMEENKVNFYDSKNRLSKVEIIQTTLYGSENVKGYVNTNDRNNITTGNIQNIIVENTFFKDNNLDLPEIETTTTVIKESAGSIGVTETETKKYALELLSTEGIKTKYKYYQIEPQPDSYHEIITVENGIITDRKFSYDTNETTNVNKPLYYQKNIDSDIEVVQIDGTFIDDTYSLNCTKTLYNKLR